MASLFFYSWWGLKYLPLITISILVNYGVGTALSKCSKESELQTEVKWQGLSRKLLLILGLTFNLGLLAYFKYANFFVQNLNAATGSDIQLAKIVLPLAISFFTFQKIAYLVDSYRGETKGYSFLDYALFVTFFPQLIAGPIVHHKEIVPQFSNHKNSSLRYNNIATGIFIFSIGLFKKIVLADTFSQWATPGFNTPLSLNALEAWTTSLSYTFQLYFDFSGYTDMAIGAALLFNIRLPINFNSPYKAVSIQDFWRRWHITLSNFLRDYLYIPLGGNRKGEMRMYANLFATFLLGGLWHGASWMFLTWGALHGGALVISRLWQRLGLKLPNFVGWFITFNFVNVAWVFFRAKDMNSALKVLHGMVGNYEPALHENLFDLYVVIAGNIQLLTMIAAMGTVLIAKNTSTIFKDSNITIKRTILGGILLGFAIIFSLSAGVTASEFLYFNF